jgi:hypothetical protein
MGEEMTAIYCTHRDCRLDTVQELLWMAKVLNRPDLKSETQTVMAAEVRCRHVPRAGAVRAPFAKERR